MTTTDDVLAAIDAEGSSSWVLADVLADWNETDDNGKPLTLRVLADRIEASGRGDRSPAALGKYRATARAFPIGRRLPMHGFNVHVELRAHPDKLLAWKPSAALPVLTVEQARRLRGGSRSARKPKRDAWRTPFDRALRALRNIAEQHPDEVLDALRQVVAGLEKTTRGRSGGLRAV